MSALIPCPVHEHARQRPQADAIRWPGSGRAIAWQLLSHYVSSTVRHFKEFGLHPRSRVIIIADLNPSLVIVVLSLWRMGVSVCVLGGSVFDPELVKAIEVLRPALVVVDRKRRIKAQQLLLEEAVALEEVKNFWYGSEDPSLMVDPRAEAIVFLENGKLVSAALEDLLGDRSDPGGAVLEKDRAKFAIRSGGRDLNTGSHLQAWRVFLSLAVVCLLAYANALTNGFMMDDHTVLFGPDGVAGKDFFGLWTTPQGAYFRPTGHVALWLSAKLFSANVVGYHVLNLFLFAVVVILLFMIMNKVTRDQRLSFLAAALFAAHPLNAVMVDYVTGSTLSSYAILVELAFLAAVTGRSSLKILGHWSGLALFLAALLAHDASVVLIPAVAAYDFFIERRGLKGTALRALPFFLLALLFFRFHFEDGTVQGGVLQALADPLAVFSTWMRLVCWYIAKSFAPQGIVFIWNEEFAARQVLSQLVVFAIVVSASWILIMRWREGWRPFFLTLFLAGSVLVLPAAFSYFGPRTYPFIEPHWLILPSSGFFVMAAGVLLVLYDRKSFWFGRGVPALALVSLLVLSWQGNMNWKDQRTYAQYWVSQNTQNWTPFFAIGKEELEQGRCESGQKYLERSLERGVVVDHAKLFLEIGRCCALQNYEDRVRAVP